MSDWGNTSWSNRLSYTIRYEADGLIRMSIMCKIHGLFPVTYERGRYLQNNTRIKIHRRVTFVNRAKLLIKAFSSYFFWLRFLLRSCMSSVTSIRFETCLKEILARNGFWNTQFGLLKFGSSYPLLYYHVCIVTLYSIHYTWVTMLSVCSMLRFVYKVLLLMRTFKPLYL